MPHEESHYPADWLRVAEKDFGRVEHLLEVEDPEAAGFFLQRAVEKFFKAFLLSKGWKLKRLSKSSERSLLNNYIDRKQ